MLFIENRNTDPYRNVALEQWLLDTCVEDCFMLWRNATSIFLGKNQNTFSEVNLSYARAHGINVVRRFTGGGAIFADDGNLMFSFINCSRYRGFTDFEKCSIPILRALKALGVPAEFSGRNDLLIEGKKFSGTAQCRRLNKVLHHGTLMFQVDTARLAQALNVRDIKLAGKGVRSVKSRVTNISGYLQAEMDIEAFRTHLVQSVREQFPEMRRYVLTEQDWAAVGEIADRTYRTGAWIYGRNPAFEIHKARKFPGGLVEAYLEVREHRLARLNLFGDFFGDREIQELERAMIGVRYDASALRETLNKLDIDAYLHNVSVEQFMSVLI